MVKINNLTLKGEVISDKMNKTIVVKVFKKIRHKRYKKLIKCFTKYFIHDEKNESKVGDFVYFKQVAPISKKKNWVLLKVL